MNNNIKINLLKLLFFMLVYIIMAKIKKIGLRAEVLHGTAEKTSGNLTKNDLKKNKYGSIVSKAASLAAKKTKNLGDHLVKKGSKGFVLAIKKSVKKSSKKIDCRFKKNKSKKECKSKKSMKKSKK